MSRATFPSQEIFFVSIPGMRRGYIECGGVTIHELYEVHSLLKVLRLIKKVIYNAQLIGGGDGLLWIMVSYSP